jgi:hypothetical protein
MVAAWIRAVIGVGPGIASGSQLWRGNWAAEPAVPGRSDDRTDVVRTGLVAQREDAEQEPDVAEPGHQERLRRPVARLPLLPVLADQEVRADAHHLPADEEHEQALGRYHQRHGRGEDEDEGSVGRVARICPEVGD